MTKPAEVAASDRVRQRSGWSCTNCWATAPPQDTPKTSTAPMSSLSSSRAREPREPAHAVGQRRRRRGADAGHVEGHDAGCAKCSANGATVSTLAPMPLKTSSVRSASAAPRGHAQALPRDVQGADVGRPPERRAPPSRGRQGVGAGRVESRLVLARAERLRRGHLAPPWVFSQFSQCGHQLPAWASAPARNASAVAGFASLVKTAPSGCPAG